MLYDVPGHRGVEALPAGEPVTADELLAIEREHGVAAGAGDVALVRTGYLVALARPRCARRPAAAPGPTSRRRGCWPSAGSWRPARTPRPIEVQPAPDRGKPANPQPVHTLLLIERGIYILESLDLEEIAAAGVREFLFVALPLAIRGATGSMVDPVAIT